MIRKHYALPAPEKGCIGVELFNLDALNLSARFHGGTGTVDASGIVDPDSFAVDLEIQTMTLQVENRDRFADWYANHYTPSAADSPIQQFASGLLLYLYLQRKDALPPFGEG